jgi:exodeoxyribonuclease-5
MEPSSMIELSDQQHAALDTIKAWWTSLRPAPPAIEQRPNPIDDWHLPQTEVTIGGRGRFFLLDGGAGTGKTTLAYHAVQALAPKPIEVCYAAYTAKAARVMQEKGMEGARTLFSAMYYPRHDEKGKLTGIFEPAFLENLDLLVIDESSMVPDRMVQDITSTGVPTIVLGDLDGQLPPVKGDPGFFNWKPDFRLTEPHRSVLNSPVDRLAWLVRQGSPIKPHMGDGDTVHVMPLMGEAVWDIITDPNNMVICGRHKSRFAVTRRCRAKDGFIGHTPCPGEPLICCRNNYGEGFINGQMVNVWRIHQDRAGLPYFTADLLVDGEVHPNVKIARYHFECHFNPDLLKEENSAWRHKDQVEFDWAYAITAHKAQGSEWPRVVVIDDRLMAHDRDFRRRWLYTAVTRSSERLTILQTGS